MPSSLIVIFCGGVLAIIAQGLWRLYFSPIAKFPGPRLAALTYWYEFYYDITLSGQYMFKIKEMHKQYGPIIRINPHELHVMDPDFFHVLYAGAGQKRDRDLWHTQGLGVDGSVLATVSHDHHRKRRAALNPFFSMQNTRKLLPLVQERIDTLVARLLSYKDTDEVVNLTHAFSSASNDVTMEFCFGESHNRVEAPAFDPSYFNDAHAGAAMIKLNSQFPWLPKIALSIPESIAEHLGEGLKGHVGQRRLLRAMINKAKLPSSKDNLTRQTIFHHLLASLPPSELTEARLIDEAMTLVSAGSHTVSWALTVATYHIISTPGILQTLTRELRTVPATSNVAEHLAALEKLPYLKACIKEALRLSYGVSIRLARSAPDTELRYREWTIPRGTSVSMTMVWISHDETIFPDSWSFRPERWIEGGEALDRYMVAFSAGGRVCLGLNLAWAEMYMGLATVFTAFSGEDGGPRMELYETGRGDVDIKADLFFPTTEIDSKGVRIKIRG